MADPIIIDEQTVDEIQHKEDDQHLPNAFPKALRAVHGVHKHKHIGDVDGQADDLEHELVMLNFFPRRQA